MNRIQRIIRLITLLQSGTARTAGELAQELSVSRRTLFRYLKLLEDAGIPYTHDPVTGYRVDGNFNLPPISLTVAETLALMLMSKTVHAAGGRPLSTSAISGINKLTATVPEPIREACEDLMSTVSIDPGAREINEAADDRYLLLQRCIDEGRACALRYESPADDDPMICEIEPLALHFATRAWYVFASSDLHAGVRVFKLSRIVEVRPLDRLFVKPKRFRVADKLGKAWALIPEGSIYNIELLFSSKVAGNVSEIQWHRSQRHERLDDGRCRMTFTVDGLGEIAWWLCGYASEVEIVAPLALRERVCDMHRGALDANQPADAPTQPPSDTSS